MENIPSIYPIAYNVLADPPYISKLDNEDSGGCQGDLTSWLCWGTNIGKAWQINQKYGVDQLLFAAIGEGFNAINGSPDYLKIVKSLIGLGGNIAAIAFPGVGTAANLVLVPLIKLLTGVFWPKHQSQDIFSILETKIKALIDQEITAYDDVTLKQFIAGFQGVTNDLQEAIQIAICQGMSPEQTPSTPSTDPTQDQKNEDDCAYKDKDLNENLRMKFTVAEQAFVSLLPQFMKSGHEVDELPYFCLAATLHLSLLQSVVLFGAQWGFPGPILADYSAQLRQYIKQYSTYVYNTYQKGEQSKKPENNSRKALNTYLSYVSFYTTECLDYVAIWRAMDPFDYPLPTSSDFTRVVVSNIMGPIEAQPESDNLSNIQYINWYNNNSAMTLNVINDFLPLQLLSPNQQLKSIDFLTYKKDNHYEFISGFRLNTVAGNQFEYTANSNGTWGTTHLYDDNPLLSIDLYTEGHGYQGQLSEVFLNGQPADGYSSWNLVANHCTYTQTDGTQQSNVQCASQNKALSIDKVQMIYPVINNTTNPRLGFISLHNHVALEVENIIGETEDVVDDPNDTSKTTSVVLDQIRTIAANKATNVPENSVLRELVTGSNVVKLEPNNSITLNFTNQTAQKYYIRFLVATKSDKGQLSWSLDSGTSHNVSIGNTDIIGNGVKDSNGNYTTNPNLQKGLPGLNGAYMLFPETKPTSTGLPQPPDPANIVQISTGTHTLTISNTSNITILLDRIEFMNIPNTVLPTSPVSKNGLSEYNTEVWSSSTMIGTSADLTTNETSSSLGLNPYYNYDFYLGGILQDSKPFQFTPGSPPNHYDVPQGFDRITLNTNDSSLRINVTGLISNDGSNSNQSFTNQEDLDNIKRLVHKLFLSDSYSSLLFTVTDYWIDQVAMKVNALSDTVFGIEKQKLRTLVAKAKQLYKNKNLLNNGDFNSFHSWLLSKNIRPSLPSPLFKGSYLFLPSPTKGRLSYAYQKINESKLKANTRYKISGFIATSDSLEIVVSRYGKEVKEILNVKSKSAHPISSDEHGNCCIANSCQCANGKAPDSHFFTYSIDVGELQTSHNLGIEFGLRIVNPKGLAQIGNLEIVEDRPLTQQEIRQVQRKEQLWKKTIQKELKELITLLQPIRNQINKLYPNGWHNDLNSHITYQDLFHIVLPHLPKQNHWFMKDREGEHYAITKQLQNVLARAFEQLEERNLVHNGTFTYDLTDWIPQNGATVITENNRHQLYLSSWDQSISQKINILNFDKDISYQLRVYAKGSGTVTVQHNGSIEILTFATTDFQTQEKVFYLDDPNIEIQIQSNNTTFTVDTVEIIEIP
ncbi:insecticidal delta-endotoxin Cry8Ea1 family protein [Bacillus thuringiensis]|uniref:insecticidal delta-endotoxin Cry8Ea1 family protein n=1 Tax=Bacillus thuringiensis TaxID=1428 RepID=UPI0018CDBD20|nr:insecticidal delta-endotoxin Cry8Ea1 family protein [Bacillus thuringiensis]